jgi:sarcosine oxidase
MKVGEHGTGQPIDPAAPRPPIDPARVARLGRYVAQWFPGLDPEPASISGCLYTTTPDEHFVVDRRGPLVICSPCSGHGFKFVPAIGDMTAALALGGTQTEAPWRLGT